MTKITENIFVTVFDSRDINCVPDYVSYLNIKYNIELLVWEQIMDYNINVISERIPWFDFEEEI